MTRCVCTDVLFRTFAVSTYGGKGVENVRTVLSLFRESTEVRTMRTKLVPLHPLTASALVSRVWGGRDHMDTFSIDILTKWRAAHLQQMHAAKTAKRREHHRRQVEIIDARLAGV